MNFLLDLHTHTLASGHAYSTIKEMVHAASLAGLHMLGITEHAPKMPGTCQLYYFQNFKVIPRTLEGVQLLFGAELNILNENGEVDLPEETLAGLDITVASLHIPCFSPKGIRENTQAVVNAIKNPYIDIIGHPDDGRYPLDYEAVVREAKKYHTLLEINNSSLNPQGFRKNTRENDLKMLKLCKEYGVPVVVSSDAHFAGDVGRFPFAKDLLKEADFPESLVANHKKDLLYAALAEKKNRSGFYKF
ncbi:MAG TPA: phosphatase [Candidatus Scybalocola faecavium]|nr:phosphatase [Candidatus Scybalocola faecavium]